MKWALFSSPVDSPLAEVESKRGQRQTRLGVLLAMPASVPELHSTVQQQTGPGQSSVRTYLICWVSGLLWVTPWVSPTLNPGRPLRKGVLCLCTAGAPRYKQGQKLREPSALLCVPQPCSWSPWAVCRLSTNLCACSRERSVCISSKAITLIKNVTCKSWPHYTLTLSQDLGLQRGREAQPQHSAKTLLLPKDHKKLGTQILNFGTGVRLQPCPWSVHSHTSPMLRDTNAVRLTWQVTSIPLSGVS